VTIDGPDGWIIDACQRMIAIQRRARTLLRVPRACDRAWIEPGNSDYGERAFPFCAEHMAQYFAAAADE